MNGLAWRETRFLMCPLTDAEVQARGEALANGIERFHALEVAHKSQKDEMKEAEGRFEGEITKLAKIVNERQEQRAVDMELRANFTLRIVEEVRLDSGEVVLTRNIEERDKLRAQGSLPLDSTQSGADPEKRTT